MSYRDRRPAYSLYSKFPHQAGAKGCSVRDWRPADSGIFPVNFHTKWLHVSIGQARTKECPRDWRPGDSGIFPLTFSNKMAA